MCAKIQLYFEIRKLSNIFLDSSLRKPLGGLEPTTPKFGDIKIFLINLDISKVMRTFAAQF